MSTTAGRAMAGMLSVFAGFERDVLGERIKCSGLRSSEGRIEIIGAFWCKLIENIRGAGCELIETGRTMIETDAHYIETDAN